MMVRFTGKTEFAVLTNGRFYPVLSVEKGWYRIVDDSGEDYLYPPECFKTVEPICRVRYIGKDMVAMRHGKIYDVLSVEKEWYRIVTETGEDCLFPPECFQPARK